MEYFLSIMDYKFTAEMEQKLDEVEDGNVAWRSVLQEFYKIFSQYMENVLRDPLKRLSWKMKYLMIRENVEVIW